MNSVIAITTIRAPKDAATTESTFTELHARNRITAIQKGMTGQTGRMFTVTTVRKPSRRKFPSIIGRKEF